MPNKPMTQQILINTLGAVVVAVLIGLWGVISDGFLVKALGGLTKEQLADNEIAKIIKEITSEHLEDKAIISRFRGPEGKQGPPGKQGKEGKQGPVGDSTIILSGAVVAFDHTDGCPEGWDEFKDGAGRFIVGVGRHKENDDEGKPIKELDYRAKEGKRQHKLTVQEMPKHDHTLVWGQGRGRPGQVTGSNIVPGPLNIIDLRQNTGEQGGGQPHNIMPPYIVLHLCKKK